MEPCRLGGGLPSPSNPFTSRFGKSEKYNKTFTQLGLLNNLRSLSYLGRKGRRARRGRQESKNKRKEQVRGKPQRREVCWFRARNRDLSLASNTALRLIAVTLHVLTSTGLDFSSVKWGG